MRRTLDIAIAGCGIAGLACATMLSRAGHRVVVFDKLETPQPLGSGLILQPVGLVALDAIGCGDAMRALGAPVRRLFGRAQPSGRIVLDVRYDALGSNAPCGVAVHRGALFQALLQETRSTSAAFEAGRDVATVADGVLTFAGGGRSVRFDLVIDALGIKSPLAAKQSEPLPYGALWANLDWCEDFQADTLEQRYRAARKMAGVLPIGRLAEGGTNQAAFFWSLKGVDHAAWRARSIDAWKDEVGALWPETAPLLDQIAAHDDLVFARYAHRTLRGPVSRNCVHVGDSWHCASPQLGQGANMALLDALALARAMEAAEEVADALALYARMRLWHIRLYQTASFLFTPAYQSDSGAIAWLRDWIVSPLARVRPAPVLLAGLVAGAWGAPLAAIAKGAK